jgi:nicotinic acid mononucleotide adenylyltransferase
MVRPGYERVSPGVASKLGNIRAVIVPQNPLEISSTHVRENVRNVADLIRAVPTKVADYIIEHKLYNFA